MSWIPASAGMTIGEDRSSMSFPFLSFPFVAADHRSLEGTAVLSPSADFSFTTSARFFIDGPGFDLVGEVDRQIIPDGVVMHFHFRTSKLTMTVITSHTRPSSTATAASRLSLAPADFLIGDEFVPRLPDHAVGLGQDILDFLR